MVKLVNNDKFMLAIFMVFAVSVSIVLKNEYLFDFANYHYYNPWALLNGRIGYDIAPATVNSFLNPLMDLYTYLLIKYFNDYPDIYYAFQGIWYGFCLFAFYKIATLFFDINSIKERFYIYLSVVIAATGWIVWIQIGNSSNEIMISFFVLSVLYWLLKIVKFSELQNVKFFLFLGLLMGGALGLKQTCITGCLASGAMLIVCSNRLRYPYKYILSYAIGGFVGFLITDGWWMYKMYQMYDNPFFPAFNSIFHSDWFDDFNFRDDRFVPPLTWAWGCPYFAQFTNLIYCRMEGNYVDMRMTFYYTIALVFLVYLIFHPRKAKQFYTQSLWFVLGVFLLVFYILWMQIFAIEHYFVVLDMLGALPFVGVIDLLVSNKKIPYIIKMSLAVIFCSILILVPTNFYYGDHGRDKKIIDIEDINLPEDTLLKLYGLPTGVFVSSLVKNKPNIRAVGHMEYFDWEWIKGIDFLERGKFRELRDSVEKNHKGPTVILYRVPESISLFAYNKFIRELLPALEGYKCRILKSNMLFYSPVYICVPSDWNDI